MSSLFAMFLMIEIIDILWEFMCSLKRISSGSVCRVHDEANGIFFIFKYLTA